MVHKYNFNKSTPHLVVLVELSNVLRSSIPSIRGMSNLAIEQLSEENLNKELIRDMLNHVLSTCEKIDEVTGTVYPYLEEIILPNE
jgi:hypothetical protein